MILKNEKSVNLFYFNLYLKGPSINDVTALGVGGIKDFVTTVLKLLLKCVTFGEVGVKNYQKLCDVIYGRPV